jgi:hypothetical protein
MTSGSGDEEGDRAVIIMRRLDAISDRLLERFAPRLTASAVVCTNRLCGCTRLPSGAYVKKFEKWDELHDTRCGACVTSSQIC